MAEEATGVADIEAAIVEVPAEQTTETLTELAEEAPTAEVELSEPTDTIVASSEDAEGDSADLEEAVETGDDSSLVSVEAQPVQPETTD